MGCLMKEAFKSLCGVNGWSYAVFWKIGCQNPRLLIWEECYYGPDSCSGSSAISRNENSDISLQGHNFSSVITGDDKTHCVVKRMMMDNRINVVGEGLVGKVACTGNHQWILAENLYREVHPPEVLKELGQQFLAGLQTVAVIPALPHGVIQFGSHKTIPENMEFVNNVISILNQLQCENYATEEVTSETRFSACHGYSTLGEPSNMIGTSSVTCNNLNYTKPVLYHSVSDGLKNMNELSRSKEEMLFTRNIPLDRQYENYDQGPSRLLDRTDYDYACTESRSGDDLYDILGADFKNRLFSNCTPSAMTTHGSDNNKSPPDAGIVSLTDTDHLLDAMVSNVRPSTNHSCNCSIPPCKKTSTNLSSSSTPYASFPYSQFEVSDRARGALVETVNSSSLTTVSTKEDSGTYSQCSSIIDTCIRNDCTTIQNDIVSKPQTSRKRLKPGENPRPRPKDRQMIQDRLKELREIIPNGAKCSIDALLERTIKHMHFLQCVRKHADKLEQVSQSKTVGNDGGVLLKDDFEGGAIWAYDLGSRSMVCPIIVEELSLSRQMLVEMLCEERCLFLEIADIIRGMGLTILKGLMEARNDKIWARFAVEANRDVTRMEIFLSLVRLLEQNCKTGMNVSNDSAMVQQFGQSVPATGRSYS